MAPVYRRARRATLVGLAANVTLATGKLVAGIVGGSFALISDAANSLGDAVSAFIVLIALFIAEKPADAEHPYGHTRAEAIAASNVALFIVLMGLYVGCEAVQRLWSVRSVPQPWTLWVAAVNVVLKESLFRYQHRVGQRTGSAAVIANAWDHRSDALASLSVFAGLSVIRWGGDGWAWLDPLMAAVVAAAIVANGVRLFRSAAMELMDLQAEPDLVARIEAVARSVPGVRRVETLWVRKSGLECFVDIHIEVDPKMSVEEGHRLGHEVKSRLLHTFPTLRDVLVHLEPASGDVSHAPADAAAPAAEGRGGASEDRRGPSR
ncbi:MAG: cation transporter [Planctomycetota bacterium]|nr:MAG: cation transporter [Planctomycetota bacterium]